MRIVYVAHAYPRWDGDVAGAFIERLCLALIERRHHVHVVAPSDQGRGGRENRHGATVHRVRYARVAGETLAYRGTMAEAARSPAGALRAWRLVRAMQAGIVEACRDGAVDAVHAHWWVPAGIAARRARRRGGPPYLLTVHGTDVALLAESRLARWAAQPVFRDAGAVSAVSEFLSAQLRAAGVYGGKTTIQPMPSRIPQPLGGSREGGVVTVGRLTRQKRIDVVLRAVARLPEMPLRIVGDGPERASLEQLTRALGITDRVTFLGALPPEAVASAIGGAEVFVFAARAEGYGLVVAEALGLGIPVVVTEDGGGAREIVPPGAGRVVPGGDADAMAQAVTALQADPGARDAARDAGDAMRARLAPEAAALVFEEMYSALTRS